jgi:hypothetical protein
MNRKNIAYFLLIVSLILFVINIFEIGFDNLFTSKILRPLSNVLLVIAMALTIRDINKKKNN